MLACLPGDLGRGNPAVFDFGMLRWISATHTPASPRSVGVARQPRALQIQVPSGGDWNSRKVLALSVSISNRARFRVPGIAFASKRGIRAASHELRFDRSIRADGQLLLPGKTVQDAYGSGYRSRGDQRTGRKALCVRRSTATGQGAATYGELRGRGACAATPTYRCKGGLMPAEAGAMKSIILSFHAQGARETCLNAATWHDRENDEAVARWMKDVRPEGARAHGFSAADAFANPLACDRPANAIASASRVSGAKRMKRRDHFRSETPACYPWNDASDRPIKKSGVAVTLRLRHSLASLSTGGRTRPSPATQREKRHDDHFDHGLATDHQGSGRSR